jgi:hypothetical protein
LILSGLDARTIIALCESILESDVFGHRLAAYRRAAYLLSADGASFAEIKPVMQKASSDEEPVLLPVDALSTASPVDKMDLITFLLDSKNTGLQQTGICLTLLHSPAANTARLTELLDSESPFVRALAFRSLAEGSGRDNASLDKVREQAAYLVGSPDVVLAVTAARIVGTLDKPSGWLRCELPQYISGVMFGFDEDIRPSREDDRRFIRTPCPEAPYSTAWQMFAWEFATSNGLLREPHHVYSTSWPHILFDREERVTLAAQGVKGLEEVDFSKMDDIAEKQQLLMDDLVSILGYYDRSCAAIEVWLMEKDRRICAERLERLFPLPLLTVDHEHRWIAVKRSRSPDPFELARELR